MIKTDVAVYGGTPAGVTAAIQAARMGRKTVLLSFNRHVGGLTSGGLTATDVGNRDSIGGLALEFYTKVGKMRGFRPSEAESVFLQLFNEAGVEVLFERHLESVAMRDSRLISATLETGETSECTNLLVPVCLSASHVAYGSIRMEPVFMILGQSAGAAAALASTENHSVQDLPYESLRKRLQKHDQRLTVSK